MGFAGQKGGSRLAQGRRSVGRTGDWWEVGLGLVGLVDFKWEVEKVLSGAG